ncbi:hypothetical protein MMC27_005450 [Xylographa pallens]|nr:hypothetical protein [Xylographa pallens]
MVTVSRLSLKRQETSEKPSGKLGKVKRNRQASVYDAVAGRVTTRGFSTDRQAPFQSDHFPAKNTPPLSPEEVLFKRRGAPQRYHENDFYWADQSLAPNQSLPDSDLAKALHVYTSNFYSRSTVDEGQTDFRSMDETALLALSILMEEASKHVLGGNGHLVFVEGEEEEKAYKPSETLINNHTGRPNMRSTNLAAQRSGETRCRKKMKVDTTGNEDSEV